MVHITGDTHGEIDSHKLTVKNFPQQKLMTKSDSLIVCGDFGCVWDGSKNDKYWQKWYEGKPFTTLFVDGNHENHKMLAEFPIENRFDGRVHQIQPSVLHLMRGEVFEIDGARCSVWVGHLLTISTCENPMFPGGKKKSQVRLNSSTRLMCWKATTGAWIT